ncbi:MAG: nucleotidyltransferase family protein [Chloroflexi bacterium]|nr:nucleotidyltransferase family protein [Chloroflexota bacterium]
MKTLKEIKEVLARHRADLEREYGVKRIGVFGSYARGEPGKRSDIDILVEFGQPVGYFKFMKLEERLGELLGVKVDLVTEGALKPHIGRRVREEVIYL